MNDLEKLYSPSKWSKRLSSDVIITKHLDLLNCASEKTRKSIPCALGNQYGLEEREQYDIFGTDLPNDAPIFIFIHGGYYQEEAITHSLYSSIAEIFYKNKIKSILIGYELAPKKTVTEILENLQKALRKCIEYARNHKSTKVFIAGHSVGAHALATFFPEFRASLQKEDQNIIKALFLIGGLYDFEPITKISANNSLKLSAETAKIKFSPLYQKGNFENVKLYIVVGEHDSPAFVNQSRSFHLKLKEEQINSVLYILENIDHFDIMEKMCDESFLLTQIILQEISNYQI
ncbi:kynurenine formamidase isoform X2 [Cylas formicarius]|uniref:kynurenine formamidase isoform X2 n=1 Tax=Cylas formicarius TaxID=197179 RepID=UPI002958700E|nr:kynurenine formamidase isoform X2 [Cylas formicarius]